MVIFEAWLNCFHGSKHNIVALCKQQCLWIGYADHHKQSTININDNRGRNCWRHSLPSCRWDKLCIKKKKGMYLFQDLVVESWGSSEGLRGTVGGSRRSCLDTRGPSRPQPLTKWNFPLLLCKRASLCLRLIFIPSVYVTGTRRINQHLSFHVTVNVSCCTPPPPLHPLPPSPSPRSAVASAQLQSANQHCNSNEWNCLWGESVSDGGPDD